MGLKDIRFTIQIVPKAPKKRPRQEGIDRVLTKRVFGVITQDTYGNAFCRVRCHDKNGNSIDDALPFTKDSYDIKGREIIFKNSRDSKGNKITIIRGIDKAKLSPNDTEHYSSLRHNWLCDGNVILKEGKQYFRLHKVIKPYNNIKDNIDND